MTTIPATRHAEDDLMILTALQMLCASFYSINDFLELNWRPQGSTRRDLLHGAGRHASGLEQPRPVPCRVGHDEYLSSCRCMPRVVLLRAHGEQQLLRGEIRHVLAHDPARGDSPSPSPCPSFCPGL